MRQPAHAASIVRRSLFESEPIRIASFAVDPVSDACGDVEHQDTNVVVLPFAGVFAKHEAPGRSVVGTPSHAVFIAADRPYRIAFPGAIGDRAIILRFDHALVPEEIDRRPGRSVVGTPSHAVFIAADTPYRIAFPGAIGDRAIILRYDHALVPEEIDRRPGQTLGSHGLLSAEAMMRRDRLRRHLADPVEHPLEIEALGLELLNLCLGVLRQKPASQPATHLRRARAVERVKEAVAVAPARGWSVASLAKLANLSPFHLCRVFRELTGVSIYDYVLRERLAQALRAVLDGGDITTIALDAGFASHSHFTARFKRFFGATPSALRQTIGARQAGHLRKIMTARPRMQA